jgi:hypothetical protein
VSLSSALALVNQPADGRVPKDDILGRWTSVHVSVFNDFLIGHFLFMINSGFKFSQLEMSA